MKRASAAATRESSSVAGTRSAISSARAAMAVGDAEVALRRVGEEAAVLHEEGIVEAESLAQFGALLQGGVLAHHVVDRVADIGEQREGDEAYRQQDENGLQQPSDDEGDHWSPALPP